VVRDEQVGRAAPEGVEHAGRGGQGDRDRPDGRGGVSHEDPRVVPILLVSERVPFVERPPDVFHGDVGAPHRDCAPSNKNAPVPGAFSPAARSDLVIRWSMGASSLVGPPGLEPGTDRL